jgi:hypothetical protein
MRILVVLVAFAIAIVRWLRPEQVPPILTATMVGLLVFGVVVQVLIEREREKEAARLRYSGILAPKSNMLRALLSPLRMLLSPRGKPLPKLELGDSGSILVWAGPHGKPILEIFEDNSLTIATQRGRVSVSTLIRDPDGSVVAELINNEWRVNPQKSFDRNYTKDALEVKDDAGDIILQVRMLEDRARFQGKFYDSSGRGVALGAEGKPQNKHGVIQVSGPNQPLNFSVKPIFKYPSDTHLGELIEGGEAD